jgi:hypothetical protein
MKFIVQVANTLRPNNHIFELLEGTSVSSMMQFTCASGSSSPEPVISAKRNGFNIGLMTSEAKAVSVSLFVSMCQAIQMAADCALMLYYRNLMKRESIVVPYVTSAGLELQFGAVVLMPECYPYPVTLSRALNAINLVDAQEINRWIHALGKHCVRVMERIEQEHQPGLQSGDWKLVLSKTLILKPMFVIRPEFARSRTNYLLHIFDLLWKSPTARLFVHFPEGCLGYPKVSPFCDYVGNAFQELALLGHKDRDYYDQFRIIGHPIVAYKELSNDWECATHLELCKEDRALIGSFLEKLREALDAIASAGVIHLDLRLTNIFYKVSNVVGSSSSACSSSSAGATMMSMSIRIIDWDDCYLLGDKIDDHHYDRIQGDLRYPHLLARNAVEDYHHVFWEMLANQLTAIGTDMEPAAKLPRLDDK